MSYRRMLALLPLVGITIGIGLSAPPAASAYETGAKWRNTAVIRYNTDPDLDAKLPNLNGGFGVPGARTAIDNAARAWYAGSRLDLLAGTTYPNGNTLQAVDFGVVFPCGRGNVVAALVCVTTPVGDNTTIVRTPMYLNTSGKYRWNTVGDISFVAPEKRDVQGTTTHEFGHMYSLGHLGASGSVMNSSGPRVLTDDDKQGATQIYGPRTGWESSNAQGIQNNVDLNLSVNGYFNNSSPPPELAPRPAELGVTPASGSRMEMMSGYAVDTRSYAYFRLFTSDCVNGYCYDNGIKNALTIQQGMKLSWYQYNYQQSTMSVDFLMTDGRPMRNYPDMVDQNGVRVHPVFRGSYPTGQWLYFEVDLSPLAGKTIRQWWIAYDNGGNGRTGQFRAYFDLLRVNY